MSSEKRERIREEVLRELYHFHLAESGKRAMIPALVEERNPEKFFALEYLAERRLIRLKREGTQFYVKITAGGINLLKQKNKPATKSQA